MNRASLTSAFVALVFGVPAFAAPATKSSNPTGDLNDALKTMRPISVPLLEQAEVQAELNLSAEQKTAIGDLIKTAKDEFMAARQQPLPLPAPGAGGPGNAAAIRAIISRQIKYDTEKIAAALKPDQLVRLRQLELHVKGPAAFADRRVARVLGLTAEQDLKIEEINIRYEPAYTEATIEARFNGADGKAVAEVSQKYLDECVKLLTKEQKASMDWLLGKRPDAAFIAKVTFPMAPAIGGFGGAAGGVAIPAIRLAPAAPAPVAIPVAPPPAPPPPPVKKEDK
jgi:hypothetical protein